MRKLVLIIILLLFYQLPFTAAQVRIKSINGDVKIRRGVDETWQSAKLDILLEAIDTIQTENLHDKYQYVAEYAQDRILVAHRITSPLLFGIRTAQNGFSSQSEEMKTAFSIMQTMTIQPFNNC